MRVLHVMDTCNRGGAETLVLDICRNCATSDISTYFASFQGGILYPEFQKSGVETFLLGRRLPVDPRSIWKLHRLILKEKIDIIHSHLTLDMVYAQLASIGTGARHVHTYHGYKFGSPAKDRFAEWLFAKCLDAHVYVSQPLSKYYAEERGVLANSVVIENGVDVNKYVDCCFRITELREELKINESVPIISMIGNFVNSGRDQLTVCKALNIVNQRGLDFVFLFIGRKSNEVPKYYDDCVEYCRKVGLGDQVRFLGGRSDIPTLLPQLDLFVYASNHDTFGLAIVEAMLSDVPVIVNDLEPFKIIGENGRYLSMYPTKDENKLADRICQFLNDRSDFVEMARAAKLHAIKKYNINRVTEELSSLYKSITTNHHE